MKRAKHSLSHYHLSTFDMGQLQVVGHYEVLAGDSVQQRSSCLLRVSPLLSPVMHPVTVRIHHWFVPYRLLWDGWEDFITGGPDGLGGSAGAFPVIAGPFPAKSLADHMGIPPATVEEVSALPFRAYALIYNENYRDEDLIPKVGFSTASGVDAVTNKEIQLIAWEKDRFTAARPWPQKGPDITLPLGTVAPVKGIGVLPSAVFGAGTTVKETGGAQRAYASALFPPEGEMAIEGDPAHAGYPGIYADLSNASAVNVNDVRRAFALQRYQEARAAYGSRFTEYLRYLGIRSSDARLQRPEYLGGGKQVISFSEVLRTGAEGTSEQIGEMFGHGIAAMRSRRYRRFFEEHGIVMTLMSVRPRTIYADGLHKSWSRRIKEDFWQKELESIGQEEVYNREVYSNSAAPGGVFGYNDRYASYRHIPSYISGDFRTTLSDWHLARQFAAEPVLNADFVECVPSKRIHAVQTEDVLWCMINHSIQARRLVGRKVIGRIL